MESILSRCPEYSRDIEPMKGGDGDNYYCQMVDGVDLMLAVSRKHLGIPDGDAARFDFKWWDNSQNPRDIMDTYLSGDVATDARFRFRYAIAPSANR